MPDAHFCRPVGCPACRARGFQGRLAIHEVIPAEKFLPLIAANAPLSVSVMKEQLRILAGAHPMSPQGFERIQGLRRLVYDSDDYREGIRAFKERRPPVFRGA